LLRNRISLSPDGLASIVGAMRRFNTAGPCDPEKHYMVPPVPRLADARKYVEDQSYFVVHAPRQTGKTTTLMALARAVTAEGRIAAVHFSCEPAQALARDVPAAERAIYRWLREEAAAQLPAELAPPPPEQAEEGVFLLVNLANWAARCPRPVALVFDEIDALLGDVLISVLRQLRAGFPRRPVGFPASIVLCGLRDVRDYKAASGGDASRLGTASPFNIKVESLKLGGFTPEDVGQLYLQHTEETGQVFEPGAVEHAYALTQGQPWLVNALAREIVEKMAVPPAVSINAGHVEEAKERLILARATHLDSLVARLNEDRVKQFIQPMLAGQMVATPDSYNDDLLYVRDLGLVAPSNPLRIANAIYKEVIVRVLTVPAESQVQAEPRSFVLPDGKLDMGRLISEFLEFWVQHGPVLVEGMSYHEAAPQLVLMAFLQRIVNGGGYVEREYAIGRGRIDLLVKWPLSGKGAQSKAWQREAIELKVWADKKPDPLEQGLKQLDQYMAQVGLDHGFLVLFDRRSTALPVEERVAVSQADAASGRSVTVVRA